MKLQRELPLDSPLCRHRVLYIGNKILPTHAKNGLESIQEPLKLLYSTNGVTSSSGVDAWLTILPDCLQLEYVEDTVKVHFPVQNLHYCAAVRFVNLIGYYSNANVSQMDENVNDKFLPLDNPLANLPTTEHPPIFVAILRKCRGMKLLECLAFICTTTESANSFVRFCFHAYADNMYLNLRTENGAKIGNAGELNIDDSFETEANEKANEEDKGNDEILIDVDVDRSYAAKQSSIVDTSSEISSRSKASRRWSNVKSKYSNRLQKKNSTAKFDTNTIVPQNKSEEMPQLQSIDVETKSDTFKYSFWKNNKKRRSQSELNLSTKNAKDTARVVPIRTRMIPGSMSKMEPVRFCRMTRLCPDSRYGSFSSFVPAIIATGPNPCQLYEMPQMVPHPVIKVMSPIIIAPHSPLFLCPPPSSVHHPLFISPASLSENDNYKLHRSLYDIPHFHKPIEERMYQCGAYFENSYDQYLSTDIFDDRHHYRKVLGNCNKSAGKEINCNSKSADIVYQKAFFGQHQGNEKAFTTVSTKQKRKPNNVSNVFSDDDDAFKMERFLEHNYTHANNHSLERENVKCSQFPINIEERIGTMNISDGDDEEYEM